MTRYVTVTLQIAIDENGKLLLPDNPSIGGYLDLNGTAIETIPQGVKVGGQVYRLKKKSA